jgi:lysophospholipase L1-like esterase
MKTRSFLAIILLALALTACQTEQQSTGLTPTQRASAMLRAEDYRDPVRVACVGDSITYGAGVEGRETNAYPAVLGRLLGEQFEARNFGVSGATLLKKGDKPYWSLSEFAAVSEFAPQVIVLKLGTNDTKPQNWEHGQEFENDLRALLTHFQALPSRPRIWVCLPVPVYESRWGISEDVLMHQVIPRIVKVADQKQLPVIDLHTALSYRPELFPDQVHPNAEGARLMAQTIYSALTGKAAR